MEKEGKKESSNGGKEGEREMFRYGLTAGRVRIRDFNSSTVASLWTSTVPRSVR